MRILHIVFCTVCKYVLSICKLLLFFCTVCPYVNCCIFISVLHLLTLLGRVRVGFRCRAYFKHDRALISSNGPRIFEF